MTADENDADFIEIDFRKLNKASKEAEEFVYGSGNDSE